jgi:HlyD family secretion protein
MKVLAWLFVVVVLGGAGWYYIGGHGRGSAKVQYRTGKVEKGEVVEGVAASGTVQPTVLVQVGTQVSGVIEKLNVDFNSKVTKGQVIALLDSRRMASQMAQDDAAISSSKANLEKAKAVVVQARADLERTKASVEQSKSDVERVQALLTQAQKDLERQKTLVDKKLTAVSDYDAAVALVGSLEAQLKSSNATVMQSQSQVAVGQATVQADEAAVSVAEAAVKQSEAQAVGDKINFDYATIVSPVDGVVVSRNVDVGQTVASSLSAPTLFLIAQDLTQVEIQASVPEADVGKLHEKQKVRFTVDAYTDKTFDGEVRQVRLASTTVSNVVTYTVVVTANNPDGLLFPGMTANATFEVRKSDPDALKVPSTALRLQPAKELLESEPEAPKETQGKETPGKETDTKEIADASQKGMPPKDGDGAPPADHGGAAAGTNHDGGAGTNHDGGAGTNHDGGAGTNHDGGAGASHEGAAGANREGGRGRGNRDGSGSGQGREGGGRSGGSKRSHRSYVYVKLENNLLRAIPVVAGISDGISTVVRPVEGAKLDEGQEVVTAIMSEEEPTTTNPFAPPRMGGGNRGGGGGGGGGGGRGR